MEYEVRFYFSKTKLIELRNKLDSIIELSKGIRTYEMTSQYDHPFEEMSFYSNEIDGRFRIRISTNSNESKCKISWKKRLSTTLSSDVNEEEEIEVNIKYEDYDNLLYLINNVLKMKSIESYERYRTIYYNDEIEISIDEYPFGIAIEIENKSSEDNPQLIVKKWVDILGLDINKSYRLSWDDKYSELCKSQNVEHFNHVKFDLPMPEVIEENAK